MWEGKVRERLRRKTDGSLQRKRVSKGEEDRRGERRQACGASMSLHFPWTHVRDPLLPSVWWSVAGAMSSRPGKSLHGSRHKSPERSELRAQRLCNASTSAPRVKTAEYIMSSMFTWRDTGVTAGLAGIEKCRSGVKVPLLTWSQRAQHLQPLWSGKICLNTKHCVLFTLKDANKSNDGPAGRFMLSEGIAA